MSPVDPSSISSRRMAIVNGEQEQGFAAVGVLLSGNKGACTATLIGERTVLTAAHCVEGRTPVRFVVGGLGGRQHYAASVSIHPRYAGGDKADLAVVRLVEPVVGIEPLMLAKQPPSEDEDVLLLGYGKTGEGKGTFGTKRAARAAVTTVTDEYYVISGATNVCDGDSGGPTLAQRDGEQVIIGVHSSKGNAPCGVEGHDMRVDRFRDWILRESDGIADHAAPEVAVLTPADGARVDGKFTVVASARDDLVISRVVLLIDGQVVESRREGPYKFEVADLGQGPHTIEVVAHDQHTSQTATIAVEVTEQSDLPMGRACITAEQCQSRISIGGFCSRACFADAPCGSGYSCDTGYCRVAAQALDSTSDDELDELATGGQGCSVVGQPSSLPLLPSLLLLAVVLRRRAR